MMTRYERDLAAWRKQWQAASEANDYAKMDQLDRAFELLGEGPDDEEQRKHGE